MGPGSLRVGLLDHLALLGGEEVGGHGVKINQHRILECRESCCMLHALDGHGATVVRVCLVGCCLVLRPADRRF